MKRGRPKKKSSNFNKRRKLDHQLPMEKNSASTEIGNARKSEHEMVSFPSQFEERVNYDGQINKNYCEVDESDMNTQLDQNKLISEKGSMKTNRNDKKIITVQEIREIAPINVLSISTDLCKEVSAGPWQYVNSKKCTIKFTTFDSNICYSMILYNFLARGIPFTQNANLNFRWYSWLRFKSIAQKKNISLKSAVDDSKCFTSLLQDVNLYYTKNAKRQKEECLEPNKGPQCFEDSLNLEQLYYYGKGITKYYRKSTFLQLLAQKYGENVKAEYLLDPTTSLINAVDFEFMITEVHEILYTNYTRHLKKLDAYAGPQCNEDRYHSNKMDYDVKFSSTSSTAKQRLHLATTEANATDMIDTLKESDLGEFYLRKCQICNKIRWLGKRAAGKFVLGTYSYCGEKKHVYFSCNHLHNTSCDEDNDIVPLLSVKSCPPLWIAYSMSPVVGFVLKTIRGISEAVNEVEVLANYTVTSNELQTNKEKVLCTKFTSSGHVMLGKTLSTGRFQSFKYSTNLMVGNLRIIKPRESLVCQSWLDHSNASSEDPNARYTVTNLCGIRDVHAVYDAMKIIHCSQCGMCSPGFESSCAHECVTVPEASKDVPLSNSSLLAMLKQSKVLSNGVILDDKFARARVFKTESVTGICTDCSKFCSIDENGRVTLLHAGLTETFNENSQESANSQGSIHDNISNINPYSVGNLMALDVFQDEASQQYAMFMDTLTQAEKLVLSPIHAVIVILRSRTNNIPFSRFGTISFAIREPVKTTCLPWHTFKQLPFVVMVSKNEDGTTTEAKINMAKIVHAKELMEREVTCPVYGTKRPFYRYCDKVHTPFSASAMDMLASQLSQDNTPVIPEGLRKLSVDKVHERSNKKIPLELFSEWLNSGFSIGNTIKDSFSIESDSLMLEKLDQRRTTDGIWKELQDFVKKLAQNKKESLTQPSTEPLAVTPSDVVKYAVHKGCLNSNSDVTSVCFQNLTDENAIEDAFGNIVYLVCEELELLLRESSNDEGESNNVAQGGVDGLISEDPEEIMKKGVQKTVLQRVAGPVVNKEFPVAEDTPGYLPMAFPDVFLTGDGCPHQTRPRSIKNSSGSYKFTYLKWVCQQPRAMINTELQFLIHSMIKRHHSKGKARLAMKSDAFEQNGLPLKEELINNAQFRDWTVSNLMMFKSSIPDTTPFWKRARDDAISVQRDWEEIVPWRNEKIPHSVMLFQTRAPPYNHHPAIHHLCPDSKSLLQYSDEDFLIGRQRNVLKYPSIVSFMCALMAEIDTVFLSRLRNGVDSYFTRFEWGANANPHSHRLGFSEQFSEKMKNLKQQIDGCLQNSKDKVLTCGQDLGDPIIQESIRTQVLDCWDKARQEYIEYMRPFYTNWNAGLLADGKKKTFDFAFERKSTTCRLQMAEVINQALSTGQFSTLDTIYVSVANGTCRHLGHTGFNDQPAKNDKCAVVKKKRVRGENQSVQYREVVTCKRRKPQPTSNKPTIEPDPCNKKLMQLQFESNDKWFNGHDPFEILHILSNADDKAVVPEFLRKPPVLNIVSNKLETNHIVDLDLQYFSDTGDSATEYVTKYAFKDVVNSKTPAQVLVTAMEKLEDGDPINQGTVQKMYNVHANAGTTSIFQATHLNQSIPHVLSNVNIKSCNISGLSLFRNDYVEEDGEDFLVPNLIKQFDGRHDKSIICIERGKHSQELKAEIQKDMCLHQFCDLYDVKEAKPEGESKRILHFRRRSSAREGRVNALKLIPCHGKRIANPRNKLYWNFCRTLCLWKIPCHRTTDFSPVGDNEESLKKSWIELFDITFVDGNGLPPWAYKYWKCYNQDNKNDGTDTSSEDDDETLHNFQSTEKMDTDNEQISTKIDSKDEKDLKSLPVIESGNELFYQNPVDRLRAAMQSSEESFDISDKRSLEFDTAVLANPEGVNFMKDWLGDRVIPSISEIHAQMANISNSEGEISCQNFDASTLNEKQKIAHDLVVDYVDKRLNWEENGQKGCAPKPLRLILMGNPGTGKSWTLKCIMSTLIKRIGFQIDLDGQQHSWTDRIKLAAPTGAASSQMQFKAQTLHRLFSIPIHLNEKDLHLDENSQALSRLMLNFDPQRFILLIIDEFSMLSRQIFAFVIERLIQCSIDLSKIGIVLIGDPAQILPIASDPLWSARLLTDQGKDCSKISILGMMRFREIFNFQQMQSDQNYDKWQSLSTPKKRLLSDEITACRKSFMKGDYSAVFLTEVKRSEQDPVSQEFTGKVLINLRYGKKCRENEMNFLRKHCATEEEMKNNINWRTANIIHGYHFHSKEHDYRPSVESDNAKALLRHNKDTGNPIMNLDSIHHPIEKESKLKTLPAKTFEGAPSKWYASKGMRVMLLRNIAPSIGLYNGSIHTLIGPIYNNDSAEVLLTIEQLQMAMLRENKTTIPIQCHGKGTQILPGSTLISINGNEYIENMFDQMIPNTEVQCKFSYPSAPPAMPDFMVIKTSNYSGPNILKLPGCENYVPIAPVENYKQEKTKSTTPQVRIALPLEGGDAATSFKGQGATFSLAEVDLDGWFHVPGIFLVAISRVKSPKNLHIRKLPNSLDLTLQRLKENVLDAQAFEEEVRTKSEQFYRRKENCGDPFWSDFNNYLADRVIQEAITSGMSIKYNGLELVEKICTSDTSIDKRILNDVILKLIQSKEYLVTERAPHISQKDFETLQNYQTKKTVQNKHIVFKPDSILPLKETSKFLDKKRDAKKVTIQPNTKRQKNNVVKDNSLVLKSRPDITMFTLEGLQNSGNNICFINAAIIALCHSFSFDKFLRECHSMHNNCTGSLVDEEPCPLCALYEIMNRAYRHHRLNFSDIQNLPIIRLTESLLRGWNLGREHDADEFLTMLLHRLENTVGFSLHKGSVLISTTCKRCKINKTKEKDQPLRIVINLLQIEMEHVRIQDGIRKWSKEETLKTCSLCGEMIHEVQRIMARPPTLLIININRVVFKKTLIDYEILVNDHRYIFRASINFHPHHYTAVGCVAEDHFVFYSDEKVQSCHGILKDNSHYQLMNRVRTPLEDNATVLLYELQG